MVLMMMVHVSIQFEALMADLNSVLRYDVCDDMHRARAGQGRAGQGRAGQGWAGQGWAGQGRARQGRAGQGRAGQGRGLTVKPVRQKQCAFLVICPGLRALGMHYEGPLQPISSVAA